MVRQSGAWSGMRAVRLICCGAPTGMSNTEAILGHMFSQRK